MNLEFTLTKNESEYIRQGLEKIVYDPMGGKQYMKDLRGMIYRFFPETLLDILEEQRTSKYPRPYIVINNLPIDEVIYGSPQFQETGKTYKSGFLSENVLSALALGIGEPYSIYFEGRELVNNLTPQKETRDDYTGLGSDVELDFHIENAALRFVAEEDCSPMGICLLGVRHDTTNNNPKTYVSDSRLALQLMSKSDLEVLYGNNFIIQLPYRWRSAFCAKMENTNLSPLITGSPDLPRVSAVFYPGMLMAANMRAEKALKNFYEAVKSVSVGITLTSGKFIYVDNRFALHSREKFQATYDENGCPYRWVQRLFVAPNLWGLRNFSNVGERVFNPASE